MSDPTLPGFVEWLSRKDPSERYEWPKADICACGQYAASLGRREWIGSNSIWSKLNRIANGSDPAFDHRYIDRSADWTFGRCLERAKKEMADAA